MLTAITIPFYGNDIMQLLFPLNPKKTKLEFLELQGNQERDRSLLKKNVAKTFKKFDNKIFLL